MHTKNIVDILVRFFNFSALELEKIFNRIKMFKIWSSLCDCGVNLLNKSKKYSAAITALATVVLTVATTIYVCLTHSILDNSQKQFEMVNRAIVECAFPQGSRIDEGRLQFINTGNLPAEDLKIICKIVQIQDGAELPGAHTEDYQRDILVPDETYFAAYKSGFKNDARNIFLIAVWKYKGKGIREHAYKSADFYWNAEVTPARWAPTTHIDYKDQLGVIDSIIVPELRKEL